ncbi:hypothetical protein BG015_004701 [Linnemannia schmuckeri]|uniref:SET domain-containing protein n=1 Tax=Linnemannia schmuckeri TaxID=64567 RepID=A0A9P5UYP9_9FUNG|nr:hypothetical protein BG015_004701 [Linnemannia schmuckeri]
MTTAHPSLGRPRPPSPSFSTSSSSPSSPPPLTSGLSSSASSVSPSSYRLTPASHTYHSYNQYNNMNDANHTPDFQQKDHINNEQRQQQHQEQYPPFSSSSTHGSPTYDRHQSQYREHFSSFSHGNSSYYNNHYHRQESPYHLEQPREGMPYHYTSRGGHRHSIDSAAADTLLMLSAAAFMDPESARIVSTHAEDKHHQQHQPERGDYHHRSHRTSFLGEEQQHNRQHHRPQMMAKTVSAPVSSSSRLPLHPLSRMPQPRELVVEETDMDVDGAEPLRRPSISDSSSQVILLSSSAVKCSTGTQTLITKGPGMRHHFLASPTSSGDIPPTIVSSATAFSTLTSATTTTTATSTGTSTSPTTTTGGSVSSNGCNDFLSTTPVSSSQGLPSNDITTATTNSRRSSKSVEPLTTTRLSFTINKKEVGGHRVMKEHKDVIDSPPLNKEKLSEEELEEGEVEEEEEEDEVMSEGVVYVNNHLTPFALSPPNKVQVVPSILTSGPAFKQQQQSHGQDSPKTPTSARTPRTPKQPRSTLKTTPRATKRSQNDPISAIGNGVITASSTVNSGLFPSGGRGKSNARDSSVDYFYSPFPPSISSPASSPSSPSAFQLHLLQLTRNFVSVQPHASPTSRFRRTTSSGALSTHGILPFSPPSSPGQEHLMRESVATHSSPTKSHGSHSHSARGAHSHRSSPGKPKWHTQPYMMFLALRAMPNRTAARQELIHAAVELDKKFSAEKGLPRVFTGKTPMNSASACLTNNGDKYFIPFKPEGSRSTHFRLAYQPCGFDTAVAAYYGWMEELIRHDWPLCFGAPRNQGDGAITGSSNATAMATVTVDGGSSRPDFARAASLDSRKRGPDSGELADEDLLMQLAFGNNNSVGGASKKIKASAIAEDENGAHETETGPSSSFTLGGISSLDYHHFRTSNSRSGSIKATNMGVQRLDLDAAGRLDEPNSCPPTPATATALALEQGLNLDDSSIINNNSNTAAKKRHLEDLDLSRVPTSLAEVVEVKTSKITNAGKGLFAKIDLPAGTPLGFYFGMPMSENEFDSLKEGVGAASQYSIMYRRTVLDATDEQGMPFKLDSTTLPWEQQQQMVVDGQVEGQELLCPFYFLNEDQDGNVSLITGSVVNQVICTTNRPVRAGDELMVFFAQDSERHWPVLVPPPSPPAHATAPKPVKAVVPEAAPAASNAKTTRKAAAAAAAAAAIAAGEMSEGSEGSGVEGGQLSHDSASLSGRPRRDTVYKPVRYSR